MRLLYCCCLFIAPLYLFAQPFGEVTFGERSNNETIVGLEQRPDGRLVALAQVQRNDNGDRDIRWQVVDSTGLLSTGHPQQLRADWVPLAFRPLDDRLAILISRDFTSDGSSELALVVYDYAGAVLADYTLDGRVNRFDLQSSHVAYTAAGNYQIGVSSGRFETPSFRVFGLRPADDTRWVQTYGTVGGPQFRRTDMRAISLPDGQTIFLDLFGQRTAVYSHDDEGNLLWGRGYGDADAPEFPLGFTATDEEIWLLLGRFDEAALRFVPLLYRIALDGSPLADYTLDPPGPDWLTELSEVDVLPGGDGFQLVTSLDGELVRMEYTRYGATIGQTTYAPTIELGPETLLRTPDGVGTVFLYQEVGSLTSRQRTRLYVASSDGPARRYELTDDAPGGEERGHAVVAYGDELIVLGTRSVAGRGAEAWLLWLDTEGRLLRELTLGSPGEDEPVSLHLHDGALYALVNTGTDRADGNLTLHRIDPATGTVRWSSGLPARGSFLFDLGQRLFSLSDGKLAVFDADSRLLRVFPESGQTTLLRALNVDGAFNRGLTQLPGGDLLFVQQDVFEGSNFLLRLSAAGTELDRRDFELNGGGNTLVIFLGLLPGPFLHTAERTGSGFFRTVVRPIDGELRLGEPRVLDGNIFDGTLTPLPRGGYALPAFGALLFLGPDFSERQSVPTRAFGISDITSLPDGSIVAVGRAFQRGGYDLYVGRFPVAGAVGAVTTDEELLVYPNPAPPGFVTVQLQGAHRGPVDWALYGAAGRRYASGRFAQTEEVAALPLFTDRLSPGIYTLWVDTGETTARVRVVVSP